MRFLYPFLLHSSQFQATSSGHVTAWLLLLTSPGVVPILVVFVVTQDGICPYAGLISI